MLDRPLTTGEIAQYCHVTDRAVLKWIDEGKLKAYRTPGNHCRVSVADFLRFLKGYHMPIPEEFRSASGAGRKILVVDDDREMVAAIRRVLASRKDIEVDVAYDGFTAGQKFTSFAPDLVLLDIRMPGMDGYEVCRNIRTDQSNRQVKIIILSGALDMDGMEKVMRLGANDYLTKPFRNEFLLMKVERWLG